MKKITRRSVLAGLASAPIVHGVINPVLKHVGRSTCAPGRLLKVYIHGAAVLDFRPPHLHVLFPQVFADVANSVYAHEYRIGDDSDPVGSLIPFRAKVRLTGVDPCQPISTLVATTVPFLQLKPKPDLDPVYYCVHLPSPNRLFACRTVPGNCGPIFKNGAFPKLQALALLLRLEYDLKSTDLPILWGSEWEDSGAASQCIHLRGEPGFASLASHNAIPTINTILGSGTNLSIADNYLGTFACPGIDEERSIIEIRNPSAASCTDIRCSMTPPPKLDENRTHPANCVSIGNCPTC